ncbi:hypothetical protein HDU88_000291 [Geranomyces variabilis]|nr:hypothetical protein HDU88_000291 [Geranomyces variabilis]
MSTQLLQSALSTLTQMPSPPQPPPLYETNPPQLRYPAASAAFNNETARAPSSYSPSLHCSQPALALPGFVTTTSTTATTTATTTTTTANANAAAVAAANARAGHSSSSSNSRGKTTFSHLPTHAQQQQRRKKLGRFRPPRMRGPNHPATAMMSTAPPTTAAPTAAVAGAAPASSSSAPPRPPRPLPSLPTHKLHQTRRARCRKNNSHRPPLAFLPPPAPPQFPHPPQRRKKGDFYRPVSSSLRREATLNNSLPSSIPSTNPDPALLLRPCLTADPPLPNAQTPDLESLLDDVFADLAALSRTEQEREEDEGDDNDYDPEEEEEDFCTPPLAGWLYPDETYAADRAKFSDVGGTTLDRTFIGMPVPEDVLDGVDSRL